MDNLIQTTISKYGMCKSGDTIIVALSGGADSVCLLHNFISIKEKYDFKIFACHLNHCLRGDEADADMEYCSELCKTLGVELFIKKADVHAVAEKSGLGCEEAGRNVRYEFFDHLSKKYNAKIATAHNSDDNLETTVYNMTRGTLLRGLSGIPKIRGNIIRPLILTSRVEIEQYCKENGLAYVTDSTNLQDDFNRNKLRHRVVPCLKEINPSVENTVLRMNEGILEISDFLISTAEKLLENSFAEGKGYSAEKLRRAHSVIQKEAAALLLKKLGFSSFTTKNLEDIITVINCGGKLSVREDIIAVNKQGYFRLFIKEKTSDEKALYIQISDFDYEQKYNYVYNNTKITLSKVKINRKNKNTSLKNIVDSAIIERGVKLRTRRAGDKIKLPVRNIGKSLKKLMNELKIPEEKRDKLLLIADGSEVLWLEGFGVSQIALPDGKAENGILISVGDENE